MSDSTGFLNRALELSDAQKPGCSKPTQSESATSTRSPRKNRGSLARRALTLLELLLVLALIVVIMALAIPSLKAPLSTWRLRSAGDQLRAEWSRARSAAIRDGRIYAFRYQPQSGRYSVSVWLADDELEALGAPDGRGTTMVEDDGRVATASTTYKTRERELPEEVIILTSTMQQADNNAVTAQPFATRGQDTAAAQGWSLPILFYSDGTTSTASVLLKNENAQVLEVSLRGLTGVARTSDVQSFEELR